MEYTADSIEKKSAAVSEEFPSTDLDAATEKNTDKSGELRNAGKSKKRGGRIWELDALKTFAFLLMFFDHLMYDLAYAFDFKTGALAGAAAFAVQYRTSEVVNILRLAFCSSVFMFASGISSVFSRNNLRRGLRMTVVAVALTLATSVMSHITGNAMTIYFGIIAMLAVSMIAAHFLIRFDAKALAMIGVACVLVGLWISRVSVDNTDILAYLGFSSRDYRSADNYPVFPNIGFFIFGMVFGKLFYKERKSLLPVHPGPATKLYSFVGKNLLILYFAHQILLFVVLYILHAIV